MARQIVLLVLLLVFVGMVIATADNAAVNVHDIIGNTDDDDAAAPSANDGAAPSASGSAVEAPIGSAEEAKAHAGEYAQPPNHGGANALEISAVAGAAAVVGYFVL
ncbi:hypothetical protein SLE2022_231860 [Rubroshorea leprosula]